MSASRQPGPAPDEALLSRVQQDNQRQIFGKLLHDVRNPVHSIRISMELFGRLARRQGDVEKLFARAGAYIGPAEAAMDQLQNNTARLNTYLAAPAAPAVAALDAVDWLVEISTLLKGARRKLQVSMQPYDGEPLQIAADRPRISHAVLHSCLNHASTGVSIALRPESREVWIDAVFTPADPSQPHEAPPARALTREELETLVGNAGGRVRVSDRAICVAFRRAE